MCDIQRKLIGALIGLARATDGNEHLITPSATGVVIESLAATDPGKMEELLGKVAEEKQKMVPDCFLCASPCGRTSDYDLNRLLKADEQIRLLKNQILADLICVSKSPAGNEKLLYKALIAVGMEDFTPEDLLPIAQEVQKAAEGYTL